MQPAGTVRTMSRRYAPGGACSVAANVNEADARNRKGERSYAETPHKVIPIVGARNCCRNSEYLVTPLWFGAGCDGHFNNVCTRRVLGIGSAFCRFLRRA
jgi:hypothetical protein